MTVPRRSKFDCLAAEHARRAPHSRRRITQPMHLFGNFSQPLYAVRLGVEGNAREFVPVVVNLYRTGLCVGQDGSPSTAEMLRSLPRHALDLLWRRLAELGILPTRGEPAATSTLVAEIRIRAEDLL